MIYQKFLTSDYKNKAIERSVKKVAKLLQDKDGLLKPPKDVDVENMYLAAKAVWNDNLKTLNNVRIAEGDRRCLAWKILDLIELVSMLRIYLTGRNIVSGAKPLY